MRGAARQNSFDAVRLLAAAAVIVGHAWALTGRDDKPAIGGIALFHVGVYVFFSLSGYLVGSSWVRDPRALPYLVRRASRIFPALVVVVVLTVFVLGPVATTLPVGRYFSSPVSWGYLGNVTTVASYVLPGVFEAHPRPVVNGSLWTLGPEFLCYLGVLGVGMLVLALRGRAGPRIQTAVFLTIAVALAALSMAPLELGGALPVLRAVVFFAVGAAFAHARIRSFPLWPAAVLVAVWIAGALLLPDLRHVWAWIALPYLVLALGSRPWPVLRSAGRFGDISYGLYLWGFPVQQLIVQFLPTLPLGIDIALVLLVTAVIAFGSWHLVEKRALAAGRRFRQSPRPSRSEPLAVPD